MNLGLETDLANPNFAGAVANPDDLLHVEFYMFTPLDQHRSQMAGKRVYQTIHRVDENGKVIDTGEQKKVPYIRIMRPGDNTSILEVEVRNDHKVRWPRQWMFFAQAEGLIEDESAGAPGWKIEEWSYVNSDQETLRNLKHARFHTVEMIAGASDAQIQRLGMGGMGLREAAKQALRSRVSESINAELAAKDKLIAEQGERLKKLEDAIFAMQNQAPIPPQPAQPEAKPKRKYTRRASQEAQAQ